MNDEAYCIWLWGQMADHTLPYLFRYSLYFVPFFCLMFASSNLKCITLAQNRCQPLRPLLMWRTPYDLVAIGLMATCKCSDISYTTSGFE